MKTSKEIRELWINFFKSKQHLYVESKSLIPYKDDSLLWINSGVATLKDFFSGKKQPPSKRIVNSQKSIRTNDIENVGITARHQTFFEMLGNFSIGDYFKKEAIEFGYEFVTQHLNMSVDKLYVTYFKEDPFVAQKWEELGIPKSHIIAGDRKTNFWDVGSGPCGPNTEIFYDRGEAYDKRGPIVIEQDLENDRYIEIWNIVFSEFNNNGDNTYTELTQKNIDTGAGLERIVSILQNGPTNFDTDLFLPIIAEIEKMSGLKYNPENYFIKNAEQEIINKHFKIIADHIRCVVNAISDGAKPSNNQRGYIIRRLIRRAYYSGKKLNIKDKSFLWKLTQIVKDSLIFDIDVLKVSEIIKHEEMNFSNTIEQGQKILDIEIQKAKLNKNIFDVKRAFKLYETYGYPIEMTNDILLENNIKLDFIELEKLKEEHSLISKKNKSDIENFGKAINSLNIIDQKISKFIGYEFLNNDKAQILNILDSENEINQSTKDNVSYVIFDKTPFYATGGGQAHDQGWICQNDNKYPVIDIFKDKNGNNVHVVKADLTKAQNAQLEVDSNIRSGLMRNHSATHLTFAALRNIYGSKIIQLGSDNNQNRLTFDFPLEKKPTLEEIAQIEIFVLDAIQSKTNRFYHEISIEEAKKMNAIMTLDEEQYFDSKNVRVVEFPGITVDLCGGTHVDNTFDIETYKIVSVESKGSNIYRIKAITSFGIVNQFLDKEIEKNKQLALTSVKKYNQLLKEKDTKMIPLEMIKINDKNKSIALNELKYFIDNLVIENKKLLKEPDKTQEIAFNILQCKNNEIIFANNVDKRYIKNACIELREKNPQSIIIFSSNFENGSSIVVISSKSNNIQELIKDETSLKGGGNQLIWQGKSTVEITQEFIENLKWK